MRASATLSTVLLGLCGLAGCEDLDEFRTDDGSVFHGTVLGSNTDTDSDGPSFIRRGFESHTEMEVTFDPALAAGSPAAEGEPATVGTIHTYLCPPETDLCDEEERTAGRFSRAKLEPIASLEHDALSQYDFPGAGRIRNFILGARFESDAGDGSVSRHAMVFISLMENGKMEVRVIAPSVLGSEGEPLHSELFGVFNLGRRTL
ncbi:MAG: hypothetical protein OXT09_37445 [Myxococcales bacterium]|nr:hypothetical protein [Myxococcales bacterium]